MRPLKKPPLTLMCLLLFALAGNALAADKAPVDYVDPLIDTVKPRWLYFSSASRPFGMVNLSPDTDVAGTWNSGYLYDSTHIRCFSHIHAWQLSGIPVMPGVGKVKAHLGFDENRAAFSHEGEIVQPGYHKVFLQDRGIGVELTSTARVGFHRYTFPALEKSHIAFSLDQYLAHGKMQASGVKQISDTEIEGYVVMAPTHRRKKPCTAYFVASFSKPFDRLLAWEKKAIKPLSRVRGKNPGFFVEFPTEAEEVVQMKLALSYVSEAQARKNLEAELPGWDFDGCVAAARQEWNQWLSRIEISGGTEVQRVKFYTDLWHALLGRRIVSDVDGQYIDNTGEEPVARRVALDEAGAPKYPHYNFDAWWGTHWSLNILWSLAYPEVLDGFCNTMLDMYDNGGLIPRGPSGGNYTFVMIGDTAAPVFASAYAKGIRNWDIDKAYAGLRKNAFVGGIRDHAGYETDDRTPAAGGGMKYYVERGYVPLHNEGSGGHREGAAQTLEYGYQDWCLAQFAKALGKEEDYALFMRRAQAYRHLFDPEAGKTVDPAHGFDSDSGWIRPKEIDGSWYAEFSPIGEGSTCRGFVESNSAIYTWFVPHDLPGLAELMGGKEAAIQKLNRQFELGVDKRFVAPHGAHSINWIDYENQPATGMAHIFNHLGAPWLSQYWVRRVKEETFGDITPYGGYNGDEDQGQMGALGVLMAIGLFEMDGGAALKPSYELTAPIFDAITIHLDQRYYPGEKIQIECAGVSAENKYIQSAQLNGQPWNCFQIPHNTLVNNSQIRLELGPAPNKAWGLGEQ